MRGICERDEGLKADHGRAEPAALPAPFQDQRAGYDAVKFMAAGYEMLQPGQIVEGSGPLRTGRCDIKYVDGYYVYRRTGETEFSTGHVLGHDWIARLQSQESGAQTANAEVRGGPKAKSMRCPELERSAMA